MTEVTYLFQADSATRDIIVKAMERQTHPVTGDKPTSVKLEWTGLSAVRVVVEYPDPKPDIPALIKAWHAEPTKSNKAKVWLAIRDRTASDPNTANMAIGGDGLAYIADRFGGLTIE